jgi:hypothetical protein
MLETKVFIICAINTIMFQNASENWKKRKKRKSVGY